MPTMSNWKPIVDDLGKLKAEISALEKREKALINQLLELGPGGYDGDLFRATVSESERWTLDSEKVKTEMGEAWWLKRCKIGTVRAVRVGALGAGAGAGARDRGKAEARDRAGAEAATAKIAEVKAFNEMFAAAASKAKKISRGVK